MKPLNQLSFGVKPIYLLNLGWWSKSGDPINDICYVLTNKTASALYRIWYTLLSMIVQTILVL
jgi:hypothetical protein